jgi:predicted nuclease of predicted toxin-antitoxin system
MRFLIDAQLPPALADLFTQAGHEAVHVGGLGMHMESDSNVGAYAAEAGMIIVTKDEDFVTMRRLSPEAPRVVWVRIGNATNRVLKMRMEPLMAETLAALAAGEEIVEIR